MNGAEANEKILVTGGTGFLGGYVLDRLVADKLIAGQSSDGSVPPTVLSRAPSHAFLDKYQDKISLLEIDLLDDKALEKLFEDFQPDRIIHLAGSADKSGNRAGELEKLNYGATVKLLELALKARVKRIVITGTADEYGSQAAPQSETLPPKPASEYALSKNRAVRHALSLYEKHRLPIVVLRPFTIYGIGQPPSMFVAQAVECAVKNLPFEMSEGFQKRDLLFVEDLADVMIKALTAENIEGEIFNAGSGEAFALRDVAQKIWNIAGADLGQLKIGARHTNRNELHDTQADITKVSDALGWKPKISLDEGLKIIIENAKARV